MEAMPTSRRKQLAFALEDARNWPNPEPLTVPNWGVVREERVNPVVSKPSEVAIYFRNRLGGLNKEVFCVLYLDHSNRVLEVSTEGQGTIDHAAVYPREIVLKALFHDATGVILCHNHPAGSLVPSEADRQLTRQIQDACRPLGVVVHDHLIVTAEGSFSFRQAGLL
jgi:DNA repair protein RadC